jgi:predicted transcriptional regulator of viral defense system
MVAALAARQHGLVARRQLIELGIDRGGIHRRVKAGRLHGVHRGVYAVGYRRLSRHGRWMAAVLSCGPRAVLSHGSAAALWGVLVISGSLIDVATPTRSRHNRGAIAVHRLRDLHPEDYRLREGIPVTSVARTLLDIAPVVKTKSLRRAIDEAERLQMFDLRAVERDRARRRPPWLALSAGSPA